MTITNLLSKLEVTDVAGLLTNRTAGESQLRTWKGYQLIRWPDFACCCPQLLFTNTHMTCQDQHSVLRGQYWLFPLAKHFHDTDRKKLKTLTQWCKAMNLSSKNRPGHNHCWEQFCQRILVLKMIYSMYLFSKLYFLIFGSLTWLNHIIRALPKETRYTEFIYFVGGF